MINHYQLAELVGHDLASTWHSWIAAVIRRHDIAEAEHFLAQILHESGGLRHTVEIWGPTDAQRRYQSHPHLGNTLPGDGFKFRGRGLIQLTGRHNYTRYQESSGVPVTLRPELLEEPGAAADAAGWYWSSRGIDAKIAAVAGDLEAELEAATRAVNGGVNGLTDRRMWLQRVVAVMGASTTPPPPPPAPPGELPEPDDAPLVADMLVMNAPLPLAFAEAIGRSSVTGEPVVWPTPVYYRARPATSGGTKLDIRLGTGAREDTMTTTTPEGKGALQSSGVVGGVITAASVALLAFLPAFGIEPTPEQRDALVQLALAFSLLATYGRVRAEKPITGLFTGGKQ